MAIIHRSNGEETHTSADIATGWILGHTEQGWLAYPSDKYCTVTIQDGGAIQSVEYLDSDDYWDARAYLVGNW